MQKKIYNSSNIIYYAVVKRMSNIFPLPVASRPPPASLWSITMFAVLLKNNPELCVSALLQYDDFSHLRHWSFDNVRMMTLRDFRKKCDTSQSVWYII